MTSLCMSAFRLKDVSLPAKDVLLWTKVQKKNLQTKISAHNGTTFTKVSYICRADEVKAVGRNARSIKTLFHW